MFGGNPLRLMEMALNNEISLFISDEILQETLRVLRDKFGLLRERVAQAQQYINVCSERVKTGSRINVIKEDPDDNRVLECAEAARSEFIITGDLDLLRLGKYGNIRIITVRSFLDHATK